ncbi:MAG: hypothetical protein KTR29_18285 [Rhodothermaceae bacterium]|nr:hypothetical protein [Rhodothermaceae bacterium]
MAAPKKPQDKQKASDSGKYVYGVFSAHVTANVDPKHLGRIKIKLPWPLDSRKNSHEAWARLTTFMAGANRGSWFIPEVGDEVLIAFEAGDPQQPYVLGSMWNGSAKTPETMDKSGNNSTKSIRSRNGVKITLEDTNGQESITLETPGGQQFSLKDGPGHIEMTDSNGNSVSLEPSGITITTSTRVTVNAAVVEIDSGMVNINAGISKFSGVVQADTVITNSVISNSYTPGVGNLW